MSQITSIPLSDLHESPFNPRKHYDPASLANLAADVKAHGRILQPLQVRPRMPALFADDPDAMVGYEIVFGHRRFRAATMAGLTEVPCMVSTMSDEEVKKAQISENLQREDVHPIEEAEGFQALLDHHQMTAADIAEMIGGPSRLSYVYARLKLLALCPEVRKACLAGEIGAEVALLVARVGGIKMQEKALGYIRSKYLDMKDGGKKSVRSIRELLNERFTLDLRGAIFDIEDEMLVPAAGHCIRCPKRSGNAPEFADVVAAVKPHEWSAQKVGADVCTDPECFATKKAAHLKREAEKLRANGKVVVDGNKARAAVDAYGRLKDSFIPLERVKRQLKSLSKKAPDGADRDVEVLVIQDPRTGATFEAVRAADVKAAGGQTDDPKGRAKNDEATQRAEQASLLAEEQRFRARLLDQVRTAARSSARNEGDLRLIASTLLQHAPFHVEAELCKLHGCEDIEELGQKLEVMLPGDMALLLLDCALLHEYHAHYPWEVEQPPANLLAAAEACLVDVEAIRAEAASTPSLAAQAPVEAQDGQAEAAVDDGLNAFDDDAERKEMEEQKVDAGSAGGSDADDKAVEEVE